MIQIGSFVKIVDNTGAKLGLCIRIKGGYRRRYAYSGDTILVSIKLLRQKRKDTLKVKKGEIYEALIVRTNSLRENFGGDFLVFVDKSSVILINKKRKIFGTRLFGTISSNFRYTKYMKILSISSGVSFF